MKRRGIVIASYLPKRQKIVVLDEVDGKTIYISDKPYSCGALIEYQVRSAANGQGGECQFLYSGDIVAMPSYLAQIDILFLHHVLELCYYFLPLQSSSIVVFYHLLALYTTEKVLNDRFCKKLFVYQFFLLLGIEPDDASVSRIELSRLARLSFAQVVDQVSSIQVEEGDVTRLLHQCLTMHPQAHTFKTTHFLHE